MLARTPAKDDSMIHQPLTLVTNDVSAKAVEQCEDRSSDAPPLVAGISRPPDQELLAMSGRQSASDEPGSCASTRRRGIRW